MAKMKNDIPITVSHFIAVLIPCLNEEATIKKVVNDFKAALPGATIYVYDNNSTDRSIEVATSSGAIVKKEPIRGKGNVVRRMFADIEADIYILVDGDDTYHAQSSVKMIDLLVKEELDMVNAARLSDESQADRIGHRFGNRVLSNLVGIIFGKQIKDMLSGYRVFSRRFAKSFPAISRGFEIETELTVHALEMRMKVAEIDTPYKVRPEGSHSKLNTIRDGINILKMIVTFVKDERPFSFFSALSAILGLSSIILAIPIFIEYLETNLVPRFPTAILSSALMILSFFSLYTGFILDTTTTARREMKRFHYLQIPMYPVDKKNDHDTA